jgi:peptide-methionine (S)-S-oxide reductase
MEQLVDRRILLTLGIVVIISIASILALRNGNGNQEGSDVEKSGNEEMEREIGINTSKYSGNSSGLATLGGGCFWCIEAVFEEVKGVDDVQSGYSGGTSEDATYEKVCTGNTGHAEVVQIRFDPDVIEYWEILDIFFHVHDPTTLDRQGADVGPQYRSVIFYHDEDQRKIAEEVIGQVNSLGIYRDPVVTQVVPFEAFYEAEDYHDDYYENNPNQPYCRLVIAPKVSKLRKQFEDKLKD